MRTYPERPILGVGAVVLDRGRVLLVKRGHEPLKGEWSLPGGAVDAGETLEAAVQRELLEKTDLIVVVEPVIDGAVLKFVAVDEQGTGDIGGGGAVIQSGGRGSMDEKTVRPRRAGQR